MDQVPVIQVLSKADITKQYLVSVPSAEAMPPLAPSSVRVKSKIISLSRNNLSYAQRGHLMGWWDLHALPASLVSEYDPAKFGRISAWGYAEIMESTAHSLPAGYWIFGYLPIGTLPIDLQMKAGAVKAIHLETSPHRQHVLAAYNRYICYSPAQIKTTPQASLGWDSLLQVLFETSFNLNRGVFAWNKALRIHPTSATAPAIWTEDDANLKDALFFIFAASAKTALSLAHQLQRARPTFNKPRAVVAVTSAGSRPVVEATGYYDHVFLYNEVEEAKTQLLSGETRTKVFFANFGARDDAPTHWFKSLQAVVKGDITHLHASGFLPQGTRAIQVNGSGMRDQRMALLGEEGYVKEFGLAWEEFKDAGGIPNLELIWQHGMDAVGKAWDAWCRDEVPPTQGLLFTL